MRILGIDPGLATIGLGLIEAKNPVSVSVVDWLTITTPPHMLLGERLQEIKNDLTDFLSEAQPQRIVVEKLFFATNKQTAIDVAQARGVILQTCMGYCTDIIEPTPLQLKSCIVGDGSADKRQMQTMVQHTLQLSELPTPDDAADGLALALYGAYVGAAVHATT